MFCRNCGTEVFEEERCHTCDCKPLDHSNFCQACGAVTFPLQKKCVCCEVELKRDIDLEEKKPRPKIEKVFIQTDKSVVKNRVTDIKKEEFEEPQTTKHSNIIRLFSLILFPILCFGLFYINTLIFSVPLQHTHWMFQGFIIMMLATVEMVTVWLLVFHKVRKCILLNGFFLLYTISISVLHVLINR